MRRKDTPQQQSSTIEIYQAQIDHEIPELVDLTDSERRIAKEVHRLMKEEPPVLPRLVDAKEAARRLGRSECAINHTIKRGTIPVTRIDSKIQLDLVALDKWIEQCTRPAERQ